MQQKKIECDSQSRQLVRLPCSVPTGGQPFLGMEPLYLTRALEHSEFELIAKQHVDMSKKIVCEKCKFGKCI